MATQLCQYQYDPLDRLSAQTATAHAPTRHFYQGSHLVTEVQGSQHRSILRHAQQPLAQQRLENGLSDTALLATDLQGSVLQLHGSLPGQRLVYTAYGHRSPASGLQSLLGFNGERCDPVTGHYLLGNGYRAFNPVLMRFSSPDSLSPFGEGGMNPYAYCKGDSINHVDRSGRFLLKILSNLVDFSPISASKYEAQQTSNLRHQTFESKIYSHMKTTFIGESKYTTYTLQKNAKKTLEKNFSKTAYQDDNLSAPRKIINRYNLGRLAALENTQYKNKGFLNSNQFTIKKDLIENLTQSGVKFYTPHIAKEVGANISYHTDIRSTAPTSNRP